jgi:hypothetical protein
MLFHIDLCSARNDYGIPPLAMRLVMDGLARVVAINLVKLRNDTVATSANQRVGRFFYREHEAYD